MLSNTLEAPKDGATHSTLKTRVWTGRLLWALGVPFMLFDASLHVANPPFVAEYAQKFGMSSSLMTPLGIVELACLALYVVPRTAVIGAVLLTAYLGGAVETQLRTGGSYGFAIFIAALLWGSLYCRDARVRSLLK